uniref:Tetratricopeptide repeat domain containing protein n=1 Tax=Babesia bovis TaxID=5865 RepID=A7AT86_BABBO|eukprot:XP_001609715.1 tetratricopeptide repeat domain containing protein [Babesia bovis T2Bo]
MDEYVRKERSPLELLDDEPVGECSDAEVDEEELNNFLMGDVLVGGDGRHKPKLSFAEKYVRKLMRRGRRGTTKIASTTRKKRKRKTAAHASKLTPQLEKLMQQATTHYLCGNFKDAIKTLKEVVRRAPGLHDPFHMLGLIYQEEYNDPVTATGYYLLAAHLVQTDLELWKRIAEMSQDLGNVDQAIYCFKKCLRNNEGEPNEEAIFSLAMCYLEKQDHPNAIKKLHFLFDLHPDDGLLLHELCKSLTIVGDKETLLAVLQTYYDSTGDLDAAQRACQLQLTLAQYTECSDFVQFVANKLQTQIVKLPLPMIVAYVVSMLHTDVEPVTELSTIWNMNDVTPIMVYSIALAMAQRCPEKALQWFYKAYRKDDPTTVRAMTAQQGIQMAKCLIIVEKNSDTAEQLLAKLLEREPNNSELIILMADILELGGKHAKSDELLGRLTTTDLDRLKMIQKPIEPGERHAELMYLIDAVYTLLNACFSEIKYRPAPCLLAQNDNKRNTEDFCAILKSTNQWIDRFLRIVNDCELDTERTYQKLSTSKANRNQNDDVSQEYNELRKDVGKNYSFLRTKKDLGLQSVEDIIGWKHYESLLESATALMAMAGRSKEGVQLLEIIANNKKRYKSNTDIVERKHMLTTVENLIFKLSCFGGIYKVALGHARSDFVNTGNLKRYAALLGSGTLAKAALSALSSSSEKDALLENRSWVTRQLLLKPYNFDLLMVAGHFCTMSGNWPFALEEYRRALMQRPKDHVAALCLAVNYFNSLSSKVVEDNKKNVVMAMAFLQYSLELRKDSTQTHPYSGVYHAECLYNLGRAMHFINMLHIAVPLYEKCIETIRQLENTYKEVKNQDALQCPCIICDICRKSDVKFPHEVHGLAEGQFVWEYERKHILRVSAIFNSITQNTGRSI